MKKKLNNYMQKFNFRSAQSEVNQLHDEYEKAVKYINGLAMPKTEKDSLLTYSDADFQSKQKAILLKYIGMIGMPDVVDIKGLSNNKGNTNSPGPDGPGDELG